jgi:hypothetical protein
MLLRQGAWAGGGRDGGLLTDANVLVGGNESGRRLLACPLLPQSLAKPLTGIKPLHFRFGSRPEGKGTSDDGLRGLQNGCKAPTQPDGCCKTLFKGLAERNGYSSGSPKACCTLKRQRVLFISWKNMSRRWLRRSSDIGSCYSWKNTSRWCSAKWRPG